jgi:hypothetical protein
LAAVTGFLVHPAVAIAIFLGMIVYHAWPAKEWPTKGSEAKGHSLVRERRLPTGTPDRPLSSRPSASFNLDVLDLRVRRDLG